MNETRKEEIQEVTKAIKEVSDMTDFDNIITNNFVEFKSENKNYRVRQPNWEETDLANKAKMIKYREMVNEKDEKGQPVYLFKKEWEKLLNKQGFNIEEQERKQKEIQATINDLNLRLATAEAKSIVDSIIKEIEELKQDSYDILLDITDKLQFSIEDQLRIFSNTYLTYLVLEEKKEDKWIRTFSSFEEFNKCQKNDLLTKAMYILSSLIYG
jgi:formaldehyde-activating enzyme involved in methanogenesis